MSSVNPLTKELVLKIVYYGPGLAGKTTTLTFLHRAASAERRGKMVSLATPVDRTLYFDLIPPNLPKVGANRVKLQLFTVPGQVHYNATRKLVLTGADGVVFVADSRRARMEANVESLANLGQNLADRAIDVADLPLVFHYNKRDLSDLSPIDALEERLNPTGRPAIETCAITGQGIQRGLELICKAVIERHERQSRPAPTPLSELDPVDEAFAGATPTLPPPARPAAETTPSPPPPPPVAPPAIRTEPAPPSPAATGALSFAPLWHEVERDRPAAIETALAAGRDAEAARLIWRELERLLTATGQELSWSSPAGMISLLGLDGRRYLAAARLAALAGEDRPLPRARLLEAYLFLAQVAAVVIDR
jgi:signal recognition particle receptor subunit beta